MLNITVDRIAGALHLCSNGRSVGMNFPYTYPGEARAFCENGYHVFRVTLPTGWRGPGVYDYRETDAVLQSILDEDPEARFLPLVWWSSHEEAAWWPGYCPEEQCVAVRPESGEFYRKCPPVLTKAEQQKLDVKHRHHDQSPSYVSYAGTRWRKEVCEAARALVRHLDESPFAERILGFYVCGGHSYEWMYWGSFIWDDVCDYSAPMQRYFSEWLKKQYGTDRLLSEAWHRQGVSLDHPPIPDAQRRLACFDGLFFDPARDQDIADYHRCVSDLVAETAIDLCAAMKESRHHQRVCGIFYGYQFTHRGGKELSNPQMKGHLSLPKILASNAVDFVAAPYDYAYRGVGGVHTAQGVTGSVLQHGKAYISSIDLAVFKDEGGGPMSGVRPRSWEESNALLVRDFGAALCSGLTMSWVDLKGGSFRAKETRDVLRTLKQIEDQYGQLPRHSAAEVALVISAGSQAYMRYGPDLTALLFSVQKQEGACAMGTPFDCVLEEDVLQGHVKPYRFYVFLNSFFHTAHSRRALRAKLQEQQASALWIFAPGCLSPEGIAASCAQELCGIALREIQPDSLLQVVCDNALACRYGFGVDDEFRRLHFRTYQAPEQILRAFAIVSSPEDEVLGTIAGIGLPGLVVHTDGDRFDAVSSAPAVPARVLRELARRAGVHLYSESDDFICVGGEFVMIYSRSDDSRTFSFPRRVAAVTDLMTGELLAAGVTSIDYTIPRNRAALWRIARDGGNQ